MFSRGLEKELPKDFYDQVRALGYKFGNMLGKGGCGTTYRCHIENADGSAGEQMAVKHIDLEAAYQPIFRDPQTSTEERLVEQQKQREEDLMSNSAWRRFKARAGIHRNRYLLLVEATPMNPNQLWAKQRELTTELKAFMRTNHPNVVNMQNSLVHEETREGSRNPNPRHVLIFMELATGDLSNWVGWRILPEDESKNYTSQIIRGLAHIQRQGIAHLDLKPDNVLTFRTQGAPYNVTLKIADFGLSMFVNPAYRGKTNRYFGGTPIYADPVITRTIDNSRKNPSQRVPLFDAYKADVWSVGMIVWQMVMGWNHFLRFVDPLQKRVIPEPNLDMGRELMTELRTKHSSQVMDNFLTHIFELNQENRISAAECCRHQWLESEVINQRQRAPSF